MSGINEKIGYDELLESRVKQLREIEDQLLKITRVNADCAVGNMLQTLRNYLNDAIIVAEEESAAF